MDGNALPVAGRIFVRRPAEVVYQSTMVDHRSLWFPRRTRRIHDIGQVCGVRGRIEIGRAFTGQHRPVGVDADRVTFRAGEQMTLPGTGQQKSRCRIRQHVLQPIGGIGGVQWHIRATGLPDRQQCDHEFWTPLQADTDQDIASDSPPAQAIRDLIGPFIEFSVRQPLVPEDDRGRIRSQCHLLFKQLMGTGCSVFDAGAVPVFEDQLPFRFRQHGQRRDPLIGVMGNGLQHDAEVIAEPTDVFWQKQVCAVRQRPLASGFCDRE